MDCITYSPSIAGFIDPDNVSTRQHTSGGNDTVVVDVVVVVVVIVVKPWMYVL
jgi:hypothetical protein